MGKTLAGARPVAKTTRNLGPQHFGLETSATAKARTPLPSAFRLSRPRKPCSASPMIRCRAASATSRDGIATAPRKMTMRRPIPVVRLAWDTRHASLRAYICGRPATGRGKSCSPEEREMALRVGFASPAFSPTRSERARQTRLVLLGRSVPTGAQKCRPQTPTAAHGRPRSNGPSLFHAGKFAGLEKSQFFQARRGRTLCVAMIPSVKGPRTVPCRGIRR